MDGMASKELILDDKVDPAVGGVVQEGSVADEACVTLSKRLKSWLGVIDVDGATVEEPSEDGAVIRSLSESDVASWESRCLSGEGSGVAGCLADIWHERRSWLIGAGIEVGNGHATKVGGREGQSCICVLDDSVGAAETVVIALRWATSLSDCAEEVVARGLVGSDDHIVTLTNTNVEPLSCVGGDGNEICSNDLQGVTIDVKRPHVLRGSVDEAEKMLLARLNLPQSVLARRQIRFGVDTVEKVVGRATWTCMGDDFVCLSCGGVEARRSVSARSLSSLEYVQISDHDRPHVNVVVVGSRSMDDNRATDTIAVLGEPVAMVPRSTI